MVFIVDLALGWWDTVGYRLAWLGPYRTKMAGRNLVRKWRETQRQYHDNDEHGRLTPTAAAATRPLNWLASVMIGVEHVMVAPTFIFSSNLNLRL